VSQFATLALLRAALSSVVRIPSADDSALNPIARQTPLSALWRAEALSSITFCSAVLMPDMEWGSNMSPASPTTSGSDVVCEQTTGVPQAMASNGVSPKPS
jgi:hypothetical protein